MLQNLKEDWLERKTSGSIDGVKRSRLFPVSFSCERKEVVGGGL